MTMKLDDATLEKTIREVEKELPQRVIPLAPEKETTLEEWRGAIQENFPELLFPAEVGLSVIAQLLIKDITNPFGLVYIDVPSAGKTITLNFFSEIEELVYASDNFSPAAFVSQAANVKKRDLAKVDLLPKIRYKTMLIRDLAPIFGGRDDDLMKNMGILTRIFDGEGLWLDGGVHGGRGYKGDYPFMFLAGSTPITPRVWKLMGNFGSRLFFLGINSQEKDEKVLAKQLKSKAVREKEKISRAATRDFIASLWQRHPNGIEWDTAKDKEELLIIVARIAKLLARLRGSINAWKEKWDNAEYDHTVPIKEMPDRLNQLLYNCARGHATVCGRSEITEEDIGMILRVALDSAPPNRIKTFHSLLDNGGTISTNDLIEKIKCSRPTALKEMEILKILELVEIEGDDEESVGRPEKIMRLKKDFEWFLSEECFKLRGQEKPVVAPEAGGDLLTEPDAVLDL